MINVPVAGDPNSDSGLDAVRALRDTYLPDALVGTDLNASVTGASAQNLDYFAITDDCLPIVFALVLGLGFVLLMLAFRSVVVPASSIVMNLLSVGAAYGPLVFVTQQGNGARLFGFQQVPIVEAWIPLFLFSVLDVPADGLRPRRRDPARCDDRPHRTHAGMDGAARGAQLVHAVVAQLAAGSPRRAVASGPGRATRRRAGARRTRS